MSLSSKSSDAPRPVLPNKQKNKKHSSRLDVIIPSFDHGANDDSKILIDVAASIGRSYAAANIANGSLRIIIVSTNASPSSSSTNVRHHLAEAAHISLDSVLVVANESLSETTPCQETSCIRASLDVPRKVTEDFVRVVMTSQNKSSSTSSSKDAIMHYPKVLFQNNPGKQLDVIVPLSGNNARLVKLATTFGESIVTDLFERMTTPEPWMPSTIRILVTRYRNNNKDDDSDESRSQLAIAANLPIEWIVFVPLDHDSFSRSRALNALHSAAGQNDCIISAVDVDMDLGTGYIQDIMTSVNTTNTVYFPIVLSMYRPSSIELVNEFLGYELTGDESAVGLRRDKGYGMYALPGELASSSLRFNESIVGWGSEDVMFFDRAVEMGLPLVRKNGIGQVHQWHDKNCDPSFVHDDRLVNCIFSKYRVEGSPFARILISLGGDRCGFDALKELQPNTTKLYEQIKTFEGFVSMVRSLPSASPLYNRIAKCYQNGPDDDRELRTKLAKVNRKAFRRTSSQEFLKKLKQQQQQMNHVTTEG